MTDSPNDILQSNSESDSSQTTRHLAGYLPSCSTMHPCGCSYIIKQRHESEIHMQLLMAVE
jgi:hypothetical protein